MSRFSIRFRLTCWNGAVATLLLAAAGLAAYFGMARALLSRTDGVLRFEYREMVELLDELGSTDVPKELPDAFLEEFLLQVTDATGVVRLQSPALRNIRMPLTSPPPPQAPPHIETLTVGPLGPIRLLTGTTGGVANRSIIRIGVSMTENERELADLRNPLLVIFPIGSAIALLTGYWLAGRALRPVHQLTTAARRLSARNLDERLKVANSDDELGRLAETLNDLLDRLGKSFTAMQQLTADASHELMTPLANIRTEAEVALRSNQPAAQLREVLESVVEETCRLTRLAERLLFLAREDARRHSHELVLLRLDELVAQSADHSQRAASAAGVILDVEPLPAAVVLADSDRLRQVFDNLIDNAIKYNEPGGRVTVRGRRERSGVLIEIEDTGIGIPAKAQSRIFDRFYRVESSRNRQFGGNGLGLSIAAAIVQSMEGRINVDAVPSGGSVFRVWLPEKNYR